MFLPGVVPYSETKLIDDNASSTSSSEKGSSSTRVDSQLPMMRVDEIRPFSRLFVLAQYQFQDSVDPDPRGSSMWLILLPDLISNVCSELDKDIQYSDTMPHVSSTTI